MTGGLNFRMADNIFSGDFTGIDSSQVGKE